MTTDYRRPDALTAQGILLDDADFLSEIVERGCSRSCSKRK
jgi:hypothetical protein